MFFPQMSEHTERDAERRGRGGLKWRRKQDKMRTEREEETRAEWEWRSEGKSQGHRNFSHKSLFVSTSVYSYCAVLYHETVTGPHRGMKEEHWCWGFHSGFFLHSGTHSGDVWQQFMGRGVTHTNFLIWHEFSLSCLLHKSIEKRD